MKKESGGNAMKLQGIFTALLTPYREDGKIDKQALKRLIDFSLNAGVNGFYVGGSTGEGVLMTEAERTDLFETVAEANNGRGVLIGHVGATSTDEAVLLANTIKKLNYDAVSAVPPFYYGHNFEAIKGYYRDIATCGLPVVIYNFPLAGSFSLTPEKLEEMMKDNPSIVAVKHTALDLFALERFKRLPDSPVVFNGYDEMLAAGLIMGADGGIGSTYNFMPHKIVSIYKAFRDGDLKKVMEYQREANIIIEKMLNLSGVCGMMNCEKELLTLMGIPMGSCKKPFIPADDKVRAELKTIAEQLMAEEGPFMN